MQTIIFRLFDLVDLQSALSKKLFIHSGAKGGSANYPGMNNAALALAGYAVLKNSSLVAYSLMYNGLNPSIFETLYKDLNSFVLGLSIS